MNPSWHPQQVVFALLFNLSKFLLPHAFCPTEWNACKRFENACALPEDLRRREGHWPLRCWKVTKVRTATCRATCSDSWKHHEFFTDAKGSATSRGMSCEQTYCRVFYKLQAPTGRRQTSSDLRNLRSDWTIRISLAHGARVKAKWMKSHFWKKLLTFQRNGILLGRLSILATLWKIWFTKDVADFVDRLKEWWTPAVTCRSCTRLVEGKCGGQSGWNMNQQT